MLESLESRRLMTASDFGPPGVPIRFPEAATAFPAATGVGETIAVIDSGIDYLHPALGGGFGPGFKVVGGYDFADDDADPMDTFGHGTEVAGVIAAEAAGGSTYQGIAPDAKLVALRIDNDAISSVPDSRIEAALQWVVDHREEFGITVVNISYGQGAFDQATVSTVYGDEIVALTDLGVAIVAAAGNDGVNNSGGINSPASDPAVISVGSTGLDDTIDSNDTQRGPALTLLAPGEEVPTTFLDGSYGLVEGTSYAAPIVSGVVALMRNVDSNLTPRDATSILRASGVAKFDAGPRTSNATRLIYSRLDVLNALNLTQARRGGSPAVQASVGRFGNQNALAVDKQGVTHFVYYDVSARTMKYATRSSDGDWSATQEIDNTLPFQGYYLSLAVDTLGQPAVAYFDGTNGDLKYARYDGADWQLTTIDSKNSTGAYPSLVFDRNGLALVTYYRKTTGDLRAARRDFDGNWTIESIATKGDIGRSTSAAVDAKGQVGVAYEDSTQGWLGYSQLNPRTNTWASTIVDKSTRGVAYTSMAFGTDNNAPWISYYDSFPANLKVASFANRRWTPETVVSRGATGLFTNLFFAGADQANVMYYDKRQNALYFAELDGGSWTTRGLQDGSGRFAAGVVDRDNGVFRYAYYDGSGLLTDSRSV